MPIPTNPKGFPYALPTDHARLSFTTTLSLYTLNQRTTIFTNPFPRAPPLKLFDPRTDVSKILDPADTARTREEHVTMRVETTLYEAYKKDITRDQDVYVWGWIDEEGGVGVEGVEAMPVERW